MVADAFGPPSQLRTGTLTVVISGASGLIGSRLTRTLEASGCVIRRLVRRQAREPLEFSWDPAHGSIDPAALEGAHAVVNLAGENLAQRWTRDTMRRIRDSRVQGTSLLAGALASSAPPKPLVFLSGSAIGIYGNRGDEVLDESSAPGGGFLAEVCREWEAATTPASDAGVRTVHLRTGLVLASSGGALAKMLWPFRLGMGGAIGGGRQWMSWIALDDWVAAIALLLRSDQIAGAVNVVAPNPVTNAEFTRTLAQVLRRPAVFNVPRFALKLALGQMADETILASQRVRPARLMSARFEWAYPALESALRATQSAS